MATKAELMAGGMPAALANKIGQDATVSGLTAAGTVQGNALQIVSSSSIFGTVAAGTGAILPSAHGKGKYIIVNGGANALLVYPAVGETINNGAANASISIPTTKSAIFDGNNNQWSAAISA